MRRLLVLIVFAAAALPAGSAHAGTYTVYACRNPSGTIVAVPWSFATNYPKGSPNGKCTGTSTYFGFGAGAVQATIPRGQGGVWTFGAPAGTRISAVSVWRFARTAVDKSKAYAWWNGVFHDTVNAADAITHCSSQSGNCGANGVGNQSSPLAANNLVSVSNVNYGSLSVWAGCWPQGTTADCSTAYSYIDGIRVFRADVTLTDNTAPIFTALPSGDLVDPVHPLAGQHSLAFAAHDTGGGLYDASLEVDGKVTQTINLGACTPPFVKAVPCKPDAAGTLSLDTSALPDGGHLIRVLLTDATGPNLTAYGPVRITTQNGTGTCLPTAPGQPSVQALFQNGHHHSLHVRYGHRARIRGRVVSAAHQPMAGVAIRPLVVYDAPGSLLIGHKPVVTDGRGIFTFTMPRGGSRLVRFGLRPDPTQTALVCSPQLHLLVPAPVSLHARPSRTHNGHAVRFSGSLRGGRIPAHGKLVVLQGLDRHRWATIATFRTRRSGGFRYTYRFRHVVRATRFALRLQVRRESGYPFATGTSRAVHVTVVP